MRFILCIVLAMLLPASALAAKGSGAISLSRAQAAAARGDQQAAAAISTTTYRQACLSGCSARGIRKDSAPVPAGQAFATRPARRLTAWQEGSGETTHSLLVPAPYCGLFEGLCK